MESASLGRIMPMKRSDTPRRSVSPIRDRLRRAIFARCRELGIDNQARHKLQTDVTGVSSMTKMSDSDLNRLLTALKTPLVKDTRVSSSLLPVNFMTAKIRALWISAYWLGVVKSKDDAALAAWMCRQTGFGSATWITPGAMSKLIDALKLWMTRSGGVVWTENPTLDIIYALWEQVENEKRCLLSLDSWIAIKFKSSVDFRKMNTAQHNEIIRELGKLLRAS